MRVIHYKMSIKVIKIENRDERLIQELYKIWKDSVIAKHLFLSNEGIEKIGKYVPSALKDIPQLIVKTNDSNKLVAFMGIKNRKLEMLFIAPAERGKGSGKELIKYGISKYDINELGVNEQNPEAKGFYEHMGFKVYKRTEKDEQGNPYPILYMRRLS